MLWVMLASCTDRGDDSATPCEPHAWFEDRDGDGFGSGAAVDACDPPSGHVTVDGDCDDAEFDVRPDASEVCNGRDDNCDGLEDVDASDATDWYDDADGDGYGAGEPTVACDAADGQVADHSDCDDDDPQAFPGADEVAYDGIDQDCDGADLDDLDGDGSPYSEDCDDEDAARSPDLLEVCDDDIDNDCDDEIDEDCQYFGGVAPADPMAVIYGEKETVACCGSRAGHLLQGGDLNDDGVSDLAMWSESDGTEFKVMYGPLEGELDTSAADARLNTQTEDAEWALDGGSLTIGDVSGDGSPDLLIGEPLSGENGGGSVAVYLGPVSGWYGASNYDFLLQAELWDELGDHIALADLTGDGQVDLVAGAAGAGTLELTYNGDIVVAPGPLTDDATLTCGDYPGLTYGGEGDGTGAIGDLGYVFLTDDFGTDGQADLLALSTNPYSDLGTYTTSPPSLLLLDGPVSDCVSHVDVDSTFLFDDVERIAAGTMYRPASLATSDVDGDGVADVLVSGTEGRDDESSDVTRAYLLQGPISALSSSTGAVAAVSTSTTQYRRIVSDIAGDLDGDGATDFAFGITEHSLSQEPDGGAVYVLFGPLSGTYVLEEDAFGVLEGGIEPFESCEEDGCEHPGSLFGWSLVAGDDYTGDGLPDLVVGAPGFEYDTGTNDKGPGAVYVYSGR